MNKIARAAMFFDVLLPSFPFVPLQNLSFNAVVMRRGVTGLVAHEEQNALSQADRRQTTVLHRPSRVTQSTVRSRSPDCLPDSVRGTSAAVSPSPHFLSSKPRGGPSTLNTLSADLMAIIKKVAWNKCEISVKSAYVQYIHTYCRVT